MRSDTITMEKEIKELTEELASLKEKLASKDAEKMADLIGQEHALGTRIEQLEMKLKIAIERLELDRICIYRILQAVNAAPGVAGWEVCEDIDNTIAAIRGRKEPEK